MMRASLIVAIALATAVALAGCAGAPPHAPRPSAIGFPDKLLDMGTAYENGTLHRIGTGLCEEVNKARERTQVRCVAYPTSGPDYNLQATVEGVFRLGLAFSAMSRSPMPDGIRHLLTLYDAPLMVVARREAGITDLRNLQNKRVEIGAATSGRRLVAENVLDALGVNPRQLQATEFATTDALIAAFCSGKVDLIIEGYGLPDAAYERLLRQCGGQLVPLPDDVRQVLQQRHPGLEPVDLSVERYTGQRGDRLATLHQQVIVVTDEKVGSEALTRFLGTALGATAQLRRLDPHMADFSAFTALAPLPHLPSHPAVVRLRAAAPGAGRAVNKGAANGAE